MMKFFSVLLLLVLEMIINYQFKTLSNLTYFVLSQNILGDWLREENAKISECGIINDNSARSFVTSPTNLSKQKHKVAFSHRI